jgi:hypothetical protein
LPGRGIELITRASEPPPRDPQDGRKLRRYRRRWIVERTIAWIGHFRRLVVRYENSLLMYAGFFHLAGAVITLRMVLKLLGIYLRVLCCGGDCFRFLRGFRQMAMSLAEQKKIQKVDLLVVTGLANGKGTGIRQNP